MVPAGTWRRLGPSQVTAAFALKRGMTLLDEAQPDDPATLAWWLVDVDVLVLGRGSNVATDAGRVSVARRSSGGGPVLWGPDLLALDVVVPKGHPLYSDDVADSYRWLGKALARAITKVGVPAQAITPAEARRADNATGALACFASVSPWEVVIDGRKVVGLSQVRRRAGTLLQAGILLSIDGNRLAGLLDLDPVSRRALASVLTERATGVADHVNVDRQMLIDAVSSAITDAGEHGGRRAHV